MRKSELSRPLTSREIVGVVTGLLAAGIALSALHLNGYLGGVVVFSALILSPFSVILHELGHAWGTVLVGGSVRYIRLGERWRGNSPREVRLLGFRWFIYGLPFSGSVQSDICTADHYRLRRCIIIAGGPAINLLMLVGAIFYSTRIESSGWSHLWAGWLFANALTLLYTIPPRMYRSEGTLRPNDGLLFLQTLRYTDETIQSHVAYSTTSRNFYAESDALKNLSLDEMVALHEAKPDSLAVLWTLTYNLGTRRDGRYSPYLLKLLDHPRLHAEHVPILIDNYLTWQLIQGPPDRPEVVDDLSLRLLAKEDSVSARGTRGCVLIDLGRTEEGIALLHDVLIKTNSNIDRNFSNVFLALAARADGNLTLARVHAQTAAKIDSAAPVLKRVADLLAKPAKGTDDTKR